MNNNKTKFKVRARLLEQMGEQLIKSESIALMELIKNSYDADASFCKIEMCNIETSDKGSIIITDNGIGMNYDIIKDVWLEIGTSNKSDIKETEKKYTKNFHRIPIGEKGIGRFGVHRLGKEIEIITRMKNEDECRLFINWDKIKSTKYIEQFPITLEKRNPDIFKNNETGTIIIIRRLRNQWDKITVRECARAITSLNSPFEGSEVFRTEFIIHNSDWLDKLINFKVIKQYKMFSFEARLEKDVISGFKYKFTPYQNMKGIEPRTIGLQELKAQSGNQLRKKIEKEYKTINLSEAKIGVVIFKGIIFALDPQILDISTLEDKKGLKDYLLINGGVRVFRDKLRIWDYGEPEDDWLEMEMRRINQPGTRISKRLLLGAVYLNSEQSQDLIEKANREGFMNNKAYQLLKDACRCALEKVEIFRKQDKEKLRLIYSPSTKKVPVIDSINDAKTIIKTKISDKKVADEIFNCLDRIQDDYEEMTNNLMISAGAGLNLVVVIHQMQKILKNITASIKNGESIKNISKMVNDLANLVEGYSFLIKKSDIKMRNLKEIVEKAMFNLEFRIRLHNIELDPTFRSQSNIFIGLCSESYVINSIMNLVDNSIWWMESLQSKKKSIYIGFSSEYKGYSTIVVADTGPGISLDRELLGKPFMTTKPDGEGMGIGLHLTTLFMDAMKGKILYPDFGDFSLPEKYKNGAIVALVFKKKEE
jgi:anti-sigma regulatory factor (Ser/Thr protein kinase)